MLYNSHLIADIIEQSSIFQDRELRNITTNLHQYAQLARVDFSFDVGCADGYSGIF